MVRELATSSDGICGIAGDGRIVVWNRAAEKTLGYTAAEVVGRSSNGLFTGPRDGGGRQRDGFGLTPATTGDPVWSFDLSTRTKAGRSVWINVSSVVIPPEHAPGGLTVHVFRDVTATKELMIRLQDRVGRLACVADPHSALTPRELEVLRLIEAGANTKRIAGRLNVSPATVRNHAQRILAKLGAHSRLEAAALARRQRLL